MFGFIGPLAWWGSKSGLRKASLTGRIWRHKGHATSCETKPRFCGRGQRNSNTCLWRPCRNGNLAGSLDCPAGKAPLRAQSHLFCPQLPCRSPPPTTYEPRPRAHLLGSPGAAKRPKCVLSTRFKPQSKCDLDTWSLSVLC